MKYKVLMISVLLFVVFNTINYNFIESNKNKQINLEYENSLNKLENHYKIFLHQQDLLSQKVYKNLIEDERIISTLSLIQNSDEEKVNKLRDYLYDILEYRYSLLKKESVSSLNFISPKNIAILRMDNPKKFGDDISNIREDVKIVNDTKAKFSGFYHGSFQHGFRYLYPIFDKEENHIATIDINYSSELLQYHLTNISNIHTHFLIDKKFFSEEYMQTDEFNGKYSISAEHPESLLALTPKHSKQKCVIDNHRKLTAVQGKIDEGILNSKKFALYNLHESYDGQVKLVTFYPIKNSVTKDTTSWLVAYSYSKNILQTLNYNKIAHIVSFLAIFILVFFIYVILTTKERLKQMVKEETSKVIHKDKLLAQQSKMASMGEMLDAIAHQWKQPLSAISVQVSALKLKSAIGDLKEEEISKDLDVVQNQVEHMFHTIDEFRSFFRPNHNLKEIEINELFKSISLLMKDELISKSITIDINCDENIKINANENDIKHLLINLINNSKEAMIENNIPTTNRNITLSCVNNIDGLYLIVHDSGKGIPEDILEDIFDAHFTTKEENGGTGIGLYMCKQIVEKYNGNINATNSNGAKFSIYLPKD